MKKILSYLCILLLASLTIASCNKSKIGKFSIDNFSNGKAGEVIVVVDNKYLTDETIHYLEDFLYQPQIALNQEEPMFTMLRFETKDFSSLFQRHRSIIQFDINPNFSSNTFIIENNVWARPQVHIYCRGNNMDSLMFLFKQNENEILESLYNNDLKRVQYYAASNNDVYIERKIKDKFGINLTVPNTYNIAREEDNFMWLRFKTVKNDRFIIIYKTEGNDLSRNGLIETRNEITKIFIPGAIEGAYPIVTEQMGFPIYNDNVNVGTISGAELRGLWESVGDKMGGPMYEFSFIDKTNENVISVGGFVYAPEEDKRDYLREVEAIVKSVR